MLINQWMVSFQNLTLEALSNSIVFTEREVPGFSAMLSCFLAPFGTNVSSCFLTQPDLPCHLSATSLEKKAGSDLFEVNAP